MLAVVSRPQKRIFLALIMASLLIAGVLTYWLWKISVPGLATISAGLPWLIGLLLSTCLFIVGVSVTGIILAIMGFRTPHFFQGVAWSAINLLFPMTITIGKLFDVEKERIERSFIEVSNHLIRQKDIIVKPDKLLILTPHCIQQEDCPHKVTKNITNCQRCGGCQVGDLAELADKYGVHLAIVTGGTLARKVVKTIRPQAMLAIACERDLTSGIQDVFPLPVIGILNQRPCGPCCNTRVDMVEVEQAVQKLLGQEQGGVVK
jgi:hypothetical protein